MVKSWIQALSCNLYVPQWGLCSFPLPFQWCWRKKNKKQEASINIFPCNKESVPVCLIRYRPSIPDFLCLWTSAAWLQWLLLLGALSHSRRLHAGSRQGRHLSELQELWNGVNSLKTSRFRMLSGTRSRQTNAFSTQNTISYPSSVKHVLFLPWPVKMSAVKKPYKFCDKWTQQNHLVQQN